MIRRLHARASGRASPGRGRRLDRGYRGRGRSGRSTEAWCAPRPPHCVRARASQKRSEKPAHQSTSQKSMPSSTQPPEMPDGASAAYTKQIDTFAVSAVHESRASRVSRQHKSALGRGQWRSAGFNHSHVHPALKAARGMRFVPVRKKRMPHCSDIRRFNVEQFCWPRRQLEQNVATLPRWSSRRGHCAQAKRGSA